MDQETREVGENPYPSALGPGDVHAGTCSQATDLFVEARAQSWKENLLSWPLSSCPGEGVRGKCGEWEGEGRLRPWVNFRLWPPRMGWGDGALQRAPTHRVEGRGGRLLSPWAQVVMA